MKNCFTIIVTTFIFLLVVKETWSNVCFSCQDSASGGDCQKNTGKMKELHDKLKADYGEDENLFMKEFKDDPYVQNCTALTGHSYCCIESFEGGGSIKAYIRTCCDGKTWSFDTKKLKLLAQVQANNDSLCQHNTESLTTTCVIKCAGNFCNGPTGSGHVISISKVVLLFCIFITFCFYNK